MNIKSVVFDIDGTIYPNGMRLYSASALMAIKNFYMVIKFAKIRRIMRELGEVYENFYDKQAEFLAKETGYSKKICYDFIENEVYSKWQSKVFKKLKLFDGFIELLEFLKEKNIVVGFVSDFPIRDRLDDIGIDRKLYDFAFSSEDYGALKPLDLPFIKIMERTSLTSDEILYVGNSYVCDVVGAKNVGMKSVHISKKVHRETIADFTCFNYKDLKKYIQTLIV